MNYSLEDLLKMQKSFSDEFFDSKLLSEQDRIDRHKIFCLALHSEVTQLADAVFYKDHRDRVTKTDKQKILYESIDVFRYFLATLNLWNFSSKEINDAFESRDAFLWDRKKKPLSEWAGQPVAVIDIDDVIGEFRECFFRWINHEFDMSLDPLMTEYYYNGMCGELTGEEAFMKFIETGMLRQISVNKKVVNALNKLHKQGYWIQLLTARPDNNLKCVYDTYYWLSKNNIYYDNVAFSSEKYRWLADKPFFKENKINFAVDDSPKNASEYAHHGVDVYVPKRSYNTSVWNVKNVKTFDWEADDLSLIVESQS